MIYAYNILWCLIFARCKFRKSRLLDLGLFPFYFCKWQVYFIVSNSTSKALLHYNRQRNGTVYL